MRDTFMSKVVELFGHSAESQRKDWSRVVSKQQCPFLSKRCYKVRKSDPNTSIGSCIVLCGKGQEPVVICPTRLLERRQIFNDCFHLLTMHEPGNEFHIVHEIAIPGGSVDYFLVSARNGKVKDFIGIEIQTLDTTGTVWPERQRLLKKLDVQRGDDEENSTKSYNMNWKMTAKTILVQMHHKVQTFEHINKKLVLVIQDKFFSYMSKKFTFDHMNDPAILGDTIQMHVYGLERQSDRSFRLELKSRVSTDTEGIAKCLGLQAEACVELDQIVASLESKLSSSTIFKPV